MKLLSMASACSNAAAASRQRDPIRA